MAYRLTVAYQGTAYSGWQRQPNAVTVQEVLEKALSQLSQCEVRVVAAGRTDRGVHAAGQVVSFVSGVPAPNLPARAWIHGTNSKLPRDVRVLDAVAVGEGFHARRDAKGKEYRYRFRRCFVLSPLESLFVLRVDPAVELAAMRRVAGALVGCHDFGAFALAGGAPGSPIRTIESAVWHEDGEAMELRLIGDGFLRGMVRGIVGTLLEVGLRRRSERDFERLLEGAKRCDAGPTAPAHGLTLERVIY